MNRERSRRCTVMLICVAAAGAGGARSEDLNAARACAGIADKTARLACYDAAFAPSPVARVAPPAASPAQPATAPAVQPVAAPAAAAKFGDNGQLQSKKNAGPPRKLDAKVQSAARLSGGRYRLTLDNGQVWETMQGDWALGFNSGDTVTISRMLFDSYQISLAGQGRSVGIKRIQ